MSSGPSARGSLTPRVSQDVNHIHPDAEGESASDKEWLTTREVASILGISCATVLRRHAQGDLPGGRRLWGHTLRFSRRELETWLTGRRAPA